MSILLYIAAFFGFRVIWYTINAPWYIIPNLQVWRLVTAPFANYNFFMIFFGIYSYIQRGCQIEREKGTAKFFLYFMTLSIISQILLVAIGYFAQHYFSIYSTSDGLWTMTFVDITIFCIKNPEATNNF